MYRSTAPISAGSSAFEIEKALSATQYAICPQILLPHATQNSVIAVNDFEDDFPKWSKESGDRTEVKN